ncbi:hypothetical protein C8R46DRAFT_1037659 [Mycena filopes]|nr:hypothetical protein C8R46DRAFT_1037659 [Mycena filopes]
MSAASPTDLPMQIAFGAKEGNYWGKGVLRIVSARNVELESELISPWEIVQPHPELSLLSQCNRPQHPIVALQAQGFHQLPQWHLPTKDEGAYMSSIMALINDIVEVARKAHKVLTCLPTIWLKVRIRSDPASTEYTVIVTGFGSRPPRGDDAKYWPLPPRHDPGLLWQYAAARPDVGEVFKDCLPNGVSPNPHLLKQYTDLGLDLENFDQESDEVAFPPAYKFPT